MLKKILLRIFKRKFILRWLVLRNTLIIGLLLGTTNLIYFCDPSFYQEYLHSYFGVIKNTLYQILLISSLGYILSKYEFCKATILSFYWIFYLKIIWMIDYYIYSLDIVLNTIDFVINSIFLIIIIYNLLKTK